MEPPGGTDGDFGVVSIQKGGEIGFLAPDGGVFPGNSIDL
jgi:hypothetical protein